MLWKRINLIIAVGTVLCLLVSITSGKPIVVHRHHGRGHVMTRPHRPTVQVRPFVRRPSYTVRPYNGVVNRRPYFHRIKPNRPHRQIVVVRTPYGRIIKAFPSPRVVTRFGVVEPVIVKVWFSRRTRQTGLGVCRSEGGMVSRFTDEKSALDRLWLLKENLKVIGDISCKSYLAKADDRTDINKFLFNPPPGKETQWGASTTMNWRTKNVKRSSYISVLTDCFWAAPWTQAGGAQPQDWPE